MHRRLKFRCKEIRTEKVRWQLTVYWSSQSSNLGSGSGRGWWGGGLILAGFWVILRTGKFEIRTTPYRWSLQQELLPLSGDPTSRKGWRLHRTKQYAVALDLYRGAMRFESRPCCHMSLLKFLDYTNTETVLQTDRERLLRISARNVTVEWLALLFPIPDVSGSKIGPETGYWGFSQSLQANVWSRPHFAALTVQSFHNSML
jgi:hypothetical protein